MLLKRNSANARKIAVGGMTPEMIEENRSEDRTLYPEHVIVGWEDVVNAQGEEVKFSKDAAKSFVAALPDWLFDNVRMFAGQPANFVESIDAEATGKN